MQATKQDIQHLNAAYAGRRVFHGELHDHAKTGGTSDGRCTLELWRREMEWLEMDFAGIRMTMGDTKMGGQCDFTGKRLVFSVGDFHKSILRPGHDYRVDLLSDKGEVFRCPVTPSEMLYFAIDADPGCKYYWAEVHDDTQKLRIAIGNPIWNK